MGTTPCRGAILQWIASGRVRVGIEEFAGECEAFGAPSVRQVSELADANETSRQDVLGESSEKLIGRDGHLALLAAMRVVFPPESDVLTAESKQSMVADSDAMGIAAEIAQDLRRAAKGWLGVYDPLLACE